MTQALPRVTIGPSIYEHIRSHLDPAGRLVQSGMTLPDEDKVMSDGLRWVAGAFDGALGHHGGSGGSVERAARVADLLVTASAHPSQENLRRLYHEVADDRALDIVDPLIEELSGRRPEREGLHDVGRWLATTASDRGAVKIGIAILGLTGADEDLDVLRALGAHDEFTLYVAVALRNGLKDAESELWAQASAVDGWGRIHCVERLRGSEDPAIRSWILREGFRNSIMYEYLAYIAATTGGLLEALRGDDVDRELLTAAGEILGALVAGGPAEDLDDYAAGADACEAYLTLMQERAETLGDFQTIVAIRSFLDGEGDWEARATRGWTASRREAMEACCDEILGRDAWDDRITVALLSDDPAELWRADEAARRRGIDTFDLQVDRIRRDPLAGPWYQAWELADAPAGASPGRPEQLADLARTLLPLDEIATGPADVVGMGPDWLPHTALNWTLQALRHHAGVGPDLVVVGLRSPVMSNRNMSLNALKQWPRSLWPAEAQPLVDDAAANDPNPKTRTFAAEILASSGA